MSNDDKKRVVLGSTMALLLGAGSYWFLGSGGGDSDGLSSNPIGQKAIRTVSAEQPKTLKVDRRQRPAKDRLDLHKGRRVSRVRQPDAKKRERTRENRKVTIKLEKPRPAA